MLVISYGIPKSGSTLAYEVIRGVLMSAGHRQDSIHNDRLDEDEPGRGIKRSFMAGITRDKLEELMAQIGRDRLVAVKTHSPFEPSLFPWIEEKQAAGELQVIASYRDPRDICLSLIDAGERSRAKGRKAFAAVGGIEKAARNVERRINAFRKWAALKGTLRLDYDMVAFETDKAIDRIEEVLKVRCDRAEVMRYAFEDAHTLKNKAKRHRYMDELDDEEKEILRKIFKKFIRKVIEKNDQSWFDDYREELLEEAAASA
jgi:hypothetical protein